MAYVERTRYEKTKNLANHSGLRKQVADEEVLEARAKLNQIMQESRGMSPADLREVRKRFDEANRQVQKDLDALREEYGRQLGKQAVESRRKLDEIRRLAEANKKDLDGVAKQVAALEKQIHNDFERLLEQVDSKKKQALCCYEQLSQMVERVRQLFPEKYELLYPEILQPGIYTLESCLGSVLDDIQREHYEAAIGLSQVALPGAVSMLKHLELYHEAFLLAAKEAKGLMLKTERRIKDLEVTKEQTIRFENGAEYVDNHGIDYWARELCGELKERIARSTGRYADFEDRHDADGMKAIAQDLKEILEQLTVCATVACNEQRIHYECREKINQILDVLLFREGVGKWICQEDDLRVNESDLRQPVFMILSRPEGYHAIIACIPERNPQFLQQGGIRCELETFDCGLKKDDRTRCDILYRDIEVVLRLNGIKLTPKSGRGNLSADSRSFIMHTTNDEDLQREKWIGSTKAAIGLM